MILLNTNVVSEAMRADPTSPVKAWFNRHPPRSLYLPAVVLCELHYGVELLVAGRRRDSYAGTLRRMEKEFFRDRIIAFEANAAAAYGRLVAARRRSGRPLLVIDGQIAATVLVNGATLATRNVADFADCGIEVVNPWETES